VSIIKEEMPRDGERKRASPLLPSKYTVTREKRKEEECEMLLREGDTTSSR